MRIFIYLCNFPIVFCLFTVNSLAFGATVDDVDLRDVELRTLKYEVDELSARRKQIDRSLFEVDALLEVLDYESEKIIGFVESDVTFQDYPGLLRGIRGTLHSRSGNTLDQSVLLAALLKNAGYDARVAAGVMSNENRAAAIRHETLPNETTRSSSAPHPSTETKAKKVLTGTRHEIEKLATRLYNVLKDHAPDSSPKPPASDEVPVYWVEYRDKSADPWLVVFPALGAALIDIKPVHYFSDTVPQELHNRVTIQVFVERSWNNQSTTKPVMSLWDKPSGLLVGDNSSITFSFLPDTFLTNSDDVVSLEERLANASIFVPLINGAPANGAMALTRKGELVPLEEAFTPFAGVFKTVADKLDLATSALSNEGDRSKEQIRFIKRVWLEISVHSPGRATRTFTRDLATWEGDQTRFNASLTREVTLTIQSGRTSPAYYTDLTYRMIENVYGLFTSPESRDFHSDNMLKSYEAHRFIANLDMRLNALGWDQAYRSAPTIVAQYRAAVVTDGAKSGFDVISMPMTWPISSSMGSGEYLNVGILGALTEHVQFASHSEHFNSAAAQLFSHAAGDWRAISNVRDLSLHDLSPSVIAVIERELSKGYVLLFLVTDEKLHSSAWWKANPATGELIATLDNGWGGVEASTDVTLRQWIINLTATNAPIKVFSAFAGCTVVFASARINQALSFSALMQPIIDFFGGGDIDPCEYISDPYWSLACRAGLAGIAMMTQVADVVSPEASYGAFIRGCMTFVLRTRLLLPGP